LRLLFKFLFGNERTNYSELIHNACEQNCDCNRYKASGAHNGALLFSQPVLHGRGPRHLRPGHQLAERINLGAHSAVVGEVCLVLCFSYVTSQADIA
jgi:hypothetical protein